jgi:hypothetical protein
MNIFNYLQFTVLAMQVGLIVVLTLENKERLKIKWKHMQWLFASNYPLLALNIGLGLMALSMGHRV